MQLTDYFYKAAIGEPLTELCATVISSFGNAEMSQHTVDKKLKEWNETWFGNSQNIQIKKSLDDIPDFLKKK